MSTPVEQIKERLGIADVIGGYLKLDRAGSSYKGKCPFHNEKTPSFFVSPARNSYYCFGCQAKGDIFTFVQEFEGLDFIGALRVLAQRAGVMLTRVDPKVRSEHARLYLLLEKATRFFEAELLKNTEAKEYLASRGLSEETKKTWRLGFAPNDWRQLFDHLLKEGFKPEEMEKVGLIKRPSADVAVVPTASGTSDVAIPAETNVTGVASTSASGRSTSGLGRSTSASGRYYDAFRGRVMFPIVDSASRVIAFSGRILPELDDGKTGKYINSPETILFSKSHVLHGLHLAKLAIRQSDAAILVEGQMDLLMAHQAGFANTVASSGTALTLPQLERLKRLSENLLIAFDSDSAGLKAAERAIHLALSLGMNVRIIKLAEKDPADLIAKDPEAWKTAVKNAKHVVDFLLDEILASALPDRDKALRVEKGLLPLLRKLPSKVEQSHFLKIIADRARLREDALWETLKKIPGTEPAPVPEKLHAVPPHRSVALERRVFGVLFSLEGSRADEAEAIKKQLRELFGDEDFTKRYESYLPERDVLLTEIELLYGSVSVPEREKKELLQNLEAESVSREFSKVMSELTSAERKGDTLQIAELLLRCKTLSAKLSSLKSARFETGQ